MAYLRDEIEMNIEEEKLMIEKGEFQRFVVEFVKYNTGCMTIADKSKKTKFNIYSDPIGTLTELAELVELELLDLFQQLDEAQKYLETVKNWSKNKAKAMAEVAYQEKEKSFKDSLVKQFKYRQSKEDMLLLAMDWIPPTPDHEKLKQLMIKELTDIINIIFVPDFEPQECWTHYQEREIKEAENNVDNLTKKHKEEKRRVAKQKEWLLALRDSLS